MNHQTELVADLDAGLFKVIGVRFCHVCRYILVDDIDPSRHLFIDPEYDAIYPQR
jgi:hypothetical protein